MYGRITKLFDIHELNIPAEYFDTSVSPDELSAHHQFLSDAYAKQIEVQTAQVGDCAVCTCEKGPLLGRTLPFYLGQDFPQVVGAELVIPDKKIGESFELTICETPCTLRLKKIIRSVPAVVNDELIADMKLGFSTLSEYNANFCAKEKARKREQNGKKLSTYLLRELTARCEYSYDSAAVDAQLQKEYSLLKEQNKAPQFDDFKAMFLEQLKQSLLLTAICNAHGVVIDENDVMDNVNQMLEMYVLMGEPSPDRNALTQQYIQAEYYNRGMKIMLDEILGKTEADA